jgi:hypothetical protein
VLQLNKNVSRGLSRSYVISDISTNVEKIIILFMMKRTERKGKERKFQANNSI